MAQPMTGANARAVRRVFELALHADVAAPLLEWSQRNVAFVYISPPGAKPEVASQRLEMR